MEHYGSESFSETQSSARNIDSPVWGEFLLWNPIFTGQAGAHEAAQKTPPWPPGGGNVCFRIFRRNENEELIFYELASETL